MRIRMEPTHRLFTVLKHQGAPALKQVLIEIDHSSCEKVIK